MNFATHLAMWIVSLTLAFATVIAFNLFQDEPSTVEICQIQEDAAGLEYESCRDVPTN